MFIRQSRGKSQKRARRVYDLRSARGRTRSVLRRARSRAEDAQGMWKPRHRRPFREADRVWRDPAEDKLGERVASSDVRRRRSRLLTCSDACGEAGDDVLPLASMPASLRLRVKGVIGREGAASATSSLTTASVSRPLKVRRRPRGVESRGVAGAVLPPPPSPGTRADRRVEGCCTIAGRVRVRSSRLAGEGGEASPSSARTRSVSPVRAGDGDASAPAACDCGTAERVRRKGRMRVAARLGEPRGLDSTSSLSDGSRLGNRCRRVHYVSNRSWVVACCTSRRQPSESHTATSTDASDPKTSCCF